MSRTAVKLFLAIYFLIFFGAVVLRIDYFPLSWVPMYAYRDIQPTVVVRIGDKEQRRRGFVAQRANGESSLLSAKELNLPGPNFRRLYNQRAFGEGPPQDERERHALSAFNRWWYETLIGPDPRLEADHPRELLRSVNATFGYGPEDPRRIVRLEASMDFAEFSHEQLARGDLTIREREHRTSVITDQGAWLVGPGGTVRLSGSGPPPDLEDMVD